MYIQKLLPQTHFCFKGIFLLFFGIGVAHADCFGTQPNLECDDVKVTEIYLSGSDHAYLKINGNVAALQPSCTLSGGTHIVLYNGLPNFKLLYASLLSAQAQGRNVNIRITPNDKTCSVAYIIVK